MNGLKWREDAEGGFVTDADTFRLVVSSVTNDTYVRFLVLARFGAAAGRLIGSGNAATVAQGMKAAQAMARRFVFGSRSRHVPAIIFHDAAKRNPVALDAEELVLG
jgi:hypothetical protein